jgi:hypothetical protein
MASLVDIGGWIPLSDCASSACARFGDELPYGTYQLNAANQRLAWIIQSPENGEISRLGIHLYVITDSQSLDIRLESVGSDGNPTGTLVSAGSEGSVAALTLSAPTFAILDSPCTVTRGQVIAVVVLWTSTVGNIRIEWTGRFVQTAFPYLREHNGTSWVKHQGTATVFVEFSNGHRAANNNLAGIYTDTASIVEGFESAAKITMSFPCRTIGMAVGCIIEGITGPSDLNLITDMEAVLYDSNSTVLASSRMFGATYKAVTRGLLLLYFETAVNLNAGSTYRFAVKLYDHSEPDPGVTFAGYKNFSASGPSDGLDFAPFKRNYIKSERSGGAWTDIDYFRTHIVPIIDQVGR